MTPERQEPYDGRPSRTVLWEPGNHGSRATRLRAGVPVKTRYAYIHREEGNHPGTCVMCHCPGGVAFRAATPWRNRGMSDIPQSAVEELANFCDVSSSRELRTNPPVIDGSTKPWNAMVLQPVPRDGAPAHAAWRAWGGCQPRPKAHNYRACCRPGRSPRPDRKELHG